VGALASSSAPRVTLELDPSQHDAARRVTASVRGFHATGRPRTVTTSNEAGTPRSQAIPYFMMSLLLFVMSQSYFVDRVRKSDEANACAALVLRRSLADLSRRSGDSGPPSLLLPSRFDDRRGLEGAARHAVAKRILPAPQRAGPAKGSRTARSPAGTLLPGSAREARLGGRRPPVHASRCRCAPGPLS
jgi:hypothetical protein